MFPIDPNAPRRKSNSWERTSFIVSSIIGVAGLVIALVSFKLSKDGFLLAKDQFEINSKESAIQSEKILKLLKSYQDIADKTLLLTGKQLNISKELLVEQVNSGRPIVGISQTEYTVAKRDGIRYIDILITVTNNGNRIAKNVTVVKKYISSDLKLLRKHAAESWDALIPLTPKTAFEQLRDPQNVLSSYYLLVSILYFDELTNQKSITENVYIPSKWANTFEEIDPSLKENILKKYSEKSKTKKG